MSKKLTKKQKRWLDINEMEYLMFYTIGTLINVNCVITHLLHFYYQSNLQKIRNLINKGDFKYSSFIFSSY